MNFCKIYLPKLITNTKELNRPGLTCLNFSENHTCCISTTSSDQSSHSRKKKSHNNIITLKEVKRFIVDCLVAVGTPKKLAYDQALLLIEADKRGHFIHGLNQLEMNITEIEKGTVCPESVPKIIKEHASTALLDALNGLGGVSGKFAMRLAIRKAQETGVGWVCVRNANHFGSAAYYVTQAMKKNCIGIALTNSSPVMVPTRARTTALGSNPFAFGISGTCGSEFLLNIAMTTAAMGKIEILNRLGKPIPRGWALDSRGMLTTDPKKALKAKRLMPLGGIEVNSGYKGSGLAMMIDVLTGVCAGANYATRVKKPSPKFKESANLGHTFIALNACCFVDNLSERLTDFCDIMRDLPPTNPKKPVVVPGDMEKRTVDRLRKKGGVMYSKDQMYSSKKLAKRLGVKMLRPSKRKLITC